MGGKSMTKQDIDKLIKWFERKIEFIEEGPYCLRPGVREGLNRLHGFVDILRLERGAM